MMKAGFIWFRSVVECFLEGVVVVSLSLSVNKKGTEGQAAEESLYAEHSPSHSSYAAKRQFHRRGRPPTIADRYQE
jgi:hypothetical protein